VKPLRAGSGWEERPGSGAIPPLLHPTLPKTPIVAKYKKYATI